MIAAIHLLFAQTRSNILIAKMYNYHKEEAPSLSN